MRTLQEVNQSLRIADFKMLANSISSEPLSRVDISVKNLLDPSNLRAKNDLFIDMHVHSFTLSNVPNNFIKALNFLSVGYKAKVISWFKKNLAKYLGQEDAIVILNNLFNDYESVFKARNITPKVFLVNLMMDMERGIDGGIIKNYENQLLELVEIKTKSFTSNIRGATINYAEQLLPFLAIDPHNPDIYKQFLSVFSKSENFTTSKKLDGIAPFVGVKLYPPLGYLPTDPVLMDVFEICETKNIPVITHIGGYRTKTNFENVTLRSRVYNTDGTFVDKSDERLINDPINFKSSFIQPLLWEAVLKQFPKLKVCFAHMGDKEEWTNYRNNPNDFTNHIWQTLDLMKRYPNAYADISYSFTVKKNIELVKTFLDMPMIKDRIMYGSDFYLTEVEKLRTKHHVEYLYDYLKSEPEKWHALTSENTVRFLFSKVN